MRYCLLLVRWLVSYLGGQLTASTEFTLFSGSQVLQAAIVEEEQRYGCDMDLFYDALGLRTRVRQAVKPVNGLMACPVRG